MFEEEPVSEFYCLKCGVLVMIQRLPIMQEVTRDYLNKLAYTSVCPRCYKEISILPVQEYESVH